MYMYKSKDERTHTHNPEMHIKPNPLCICMYLYNQYLNSSIYSSCLFAACNFTVGGKVRVLKLLLSYQLIIFDLKKNLEFILSQLQCMQCYIRTGAHLMFTPFPKYYLCICIGRYRRGNVGRTRSWNPPPP